MKMRDQKGFTLIELLIVVAIIGIIAAIAIPGLLRARMSGNEASAIGSLRAINSAQVNFAANCGQGNYADSLPNLALPAAAGSEGFISTDLSAAAPVKSGYNIIFSPGAAPVTAPTVCNAATTAVTFAVNADPAAFGSSGTRYFFTNGGTIYQDSTATIPVVQTGPPAAPAVPIQ